MAIQNYEGNKNDLIELVETLNTSYGYVSKITGPLYDLSGDKIELLNSLIELQGHLDIVEEWINSMRGIIEEMEVQIDNGEDIELQNNLKKQYIEDLVSCRK